MHDSASKPMIIVVDDSPSSRLFHAKTLLDAGYAVLTLPSAAGLTDTAARIHPSVIVLDVVMPGVSGFEAARGLRADARTRAIPIIFATSRDAPSDHVWGARQGAVAHLGKPVDAGLLLRTVAQWAPLPA